MTAMKRDELQNLLVRIDERVKAIQEDIREINVARHCDSHEEKIKYLERMVWGCFAGLTGVGARVLYDSLR